MNPRTQKIAGASIAGAGVVAVLAVGSNFAFAETPTPTPSASSASPSASSTSTPSASSSSSPSATPSETGRRGRGDHTAVTGDEAAKVTAAVTAKDAAVTVTGVWKDADGSYVVFGTKDGARVKFDVSADLSSITQSTRDGRGPGRHSGETAVTGDEAAKVTAAVTAKDAAVTVTAVWKDADGSYVVFGTKDGARVKFDVSADLSSITQSTRDGRGPGRHSGETAVTGDEAAKVTAAVTAKDSAVTVTAVWKDADGSYVVFGTKDGARVKFDVSADLSTVTLRTKAGR